MSVVEIALTETRLWSWSANTHADLVPSVTPASDGRTLVVGEPLAPPSIAVSAAQLATADRIAYDPGMPTPEYALATVFGATLEQLRVPPPVEQLTIVHPTEWDPYRLELLTSAAGRYGTQVALEEIALRAVTVAQRPRDIRTVVLEFGPLTTTVSTVVPTDGGRRIESCEHEPTLAASEIGGSEQGVVAFRALFERLVHGRPFDSVIIVGRAEADFRTTVGGLVAEQSDRAEVLVVAGADLVRSDRNEATAYQPTFPPAQADSEWLQPLRERVAATRPPRSKTPLYLTAAAVVVLLVLVAGGIALIRASGGGESDVVASPPPSSAESGAGPSTETAEPGAARHTFGAVRLAVPDGWRVGVASAETGRMELVPTAGTRARITVTQQTVAPDVGYDQIAATLEAQIARRPAGSVSAIRRDAVFAGRPGLAYSEHPDDGSTVDWHVIVEHSVQVSVGCQYQTGGHDSIAPICENLATSLDVTP